MPGNVCQAYTRRVLAECTYRIFIFLEILAGMQRISPGGRIG